MTERRKSDSIIWYLMVTAMSIIILGGGAWATNINAKVDKIASMESSIIYIQNDVSEIKHLILSVVKKGE